MAENRVRIIIEAPASDAVQELARVGAALDGVGAKGQQAGANAGTALSDVKARTVELGRQGQAAASSLEDAFRRLGMRSGAAIRSDISETIAAYRQLKESGQVSGRDLEAALNATRAKVSDLRKELSRVDNMPALASARSAAAGLAGNLDHVRSVASQVATVLVGAFGVQQVISFAQEVIGAAVAMEQLAATYKAVFKDSGAEQLRYAAGIADAFGKSVLDVANAYKKFAAASEAVGLSTENQRRTFEAVTAAITKVGGSSQDVAGALLALEQMLSKGTVQAEEYRQQFAERIPGALKMGADALGVSTAAFQKMMENGEVIADTFIPKLATQLEKFGAGWQATADTAAANAARLRNSFLELSDTSVVTGVVTLVEKAATAFNKNLTHNFELFSLTFRSMVAESKGELSPFTTWLNDVDGLKKKFEALDQRKATFVKDLKDQAQGLADALVRVQTHQVDFGPSGETVDQLRQKLKWFQDQITMLTGQTWVVSVVANVDDSQLKQAQRYIQDIIKGTAEAKARTVESQRYDLENAVNTLNKNKNKLEGKLLNTNADLREKSDIQVQLEAINKDIEDATLGFKVLDDEKKKALEQTFNENSEVKKYTRDRSGINTSELSKATQLSDAHALSVARQKDAYTKLGMGLLDIHGYYKEVGRAQEAESVSVEKIGKSLERGARSAANAANAAARYGEQAAAFRDGILASIEQTQDALTGGTERNSARIDKWFEQQFDAIRQKVIGAKGDVSQYAAAWVALEQAWPGLHILAVTKDTTEALKKQAQLLQDIASATNDPALMDQAGQLSAKAWFETNRQLVETTYTDEVQKAEMLAALQRGYDAKLLESRSKAYEGVSAVSSRYWDAERELLETRLAMVKREASDETAYRIYEAQQWDAYNKRLLENQIQNGTSFAQILAAKWHLTYGGYKSAAGQTRDEWEKTSDSIINATNGAIDGVSGGLGDLIRSFDGTASSLESIVNSLLARLRDVIASWVEDIVKNWLTKLASGFMGGGAQQAATGGGVEGIGSGGGALLQGFSGLLSSSKKNTDPVDAAFAARAAKAATDTSANAGASIGSITGGISAATGLMSKVASWLPVVGSVIAIGGSILGLLMGNNEKKKEPVKLYDATASVVSGGYATGAHYEVMSDGSYKLSPLTPDELKKAQDAFDDLVKGVKNAAKVLGIDLVDGVAKTFSFFSGIITDEAASTVAWVQQDRYARDALGDLAGAVVFFTDGAENAAEVLTKLAGAYSNVKGRIEAIGVNFSRLADVSEEYLLAIASFATDQYSEIASTTVDNAAASMASAASSADSLASASADAAAYLEKYRDQITALAEANVAQMYQDALGGEDSFNAAMEIVEKYVVTGRDRLSGAEDYYTAKLDDLLAGFADDFSGVLVGFDATKIDSADISTFWSAFYEAMQSAMPPSMLASWSEMASYAKQIEETAGELAELDFTDASLKRDLAARLQDAQGQGAAAEVTRLLANQEKELYEARSKGYTYTQQARIAEVQAAELQAKLNTLLGETTAATSSYDAALAALTKAVKSSVEALSAVASTASGAATSWKSASDSLKSSLESLDGSSGTYLPGVAAARMATVEELYKKGMRGDAAAMAELGGAASSAWEAVKSTAATPEEYDTAYWTLINRLATAQAEAEGKGDYQQIIADLAQQQVDILQRISDALAKDTPDTGLVAAAASLASLVKTFQVNYAAKQAGRMDAGAFATAASGSEADLTAWINAFLAQNSTISMDQVRAMTSLGDFLAAEMASGSTLTREQLAALYNSTESVGSGVLQGIVGQSAYLAAVMSGQVELGGLSREQAQLLASALQSLETVSQITGTGLDYSAQAAYYLSMVADGVEVSGWQSLVSAVSDGTAQQIAVLRESIAKRSAEAQALYAKAEAQAATTAAQKGYFEAIYGLLQKQSQIELYKEMISQKESTANTYANYAMMAAMMGSSSMAMVFFSYKSQIEQEIAALESALAYWQAYVPTVALADGGVTTGPMSAIIGEAGPEAVIPLSVLGSYLAPRVSYTVDMSPVARALDNLDARLQAIEQNTRETSRNTDDRTRYQDAGR